MDPCGSDSVQASQSSTVKSDRTSSSQPTPFSIDEENEALQKTGGVSAATAPGGDHGQDNLEQHCDVHFHESVQVHLNRLLHLYESLEARVHRLEHIETGPHSSGPLSPAMPPLPSVSAGANDPHSMVSTYSVCPRSIYHHPADEIAKADLDEFCMPVLQRKASPSIGELNMIVMKLKAHRYASADNRTLLSKVGQWFRRKREYMGQRIFTTCMKRFLPTLSKMEIACITESVRVDDLLVDDFIREANLELTDVLAARKFCREKILTFLQNL